MVKHGYTIGIDLISVGEVDSTYGIYESIDCTEWKMVASSKIISDLIQFAKITYHTDTPMIMPEQITQLLKYEFIAKREQKLIDKFKCCFVVIEILNKVCMAMMRNSEYDNTCVGYNTNK